MPKKTCDRCSEPVVQTLVDTTKEPTEYRRACRSHIESATPEATKANDARAPNPAIPIWAVIHNVAIWSSGFLFANGSAVWAIAAGVVGLGSLIWMVGLLGPFNFGDNRPGEGTE